MSEMTVTEARARLADVVDQARVEHDPVFLTRRGRRVAARAEMTETGQDAIPWEQVKADLGLA